MASGNVTMNVAGAKVARDACDRQGRPAATGKSATNVTNAHVPAAVTSQNIGRPPLRATTTNGVAKKNKSGTCPHQQ
jgi:hypothetical protein